MLVAKVRMAKSAIHKRALLKNIATDPNGETVQMDEEPCYFDWLPPEIIEKILFRLSIEDCRSCRLVRPQWYYILERKICLHFKLTPDKLTAFQDANLPRLDKLTVDMEQMFENPVLMKVQTKELLEGVSTMKFNTSVNTQPVAHGRAAFSATYSNFISGEFKTFLLACANIRVLILDFRNLSNYFLNNLSLRQHCELNSLVTLELYVTFNVVSIEMVSSLSGLKTPSLRNLKIEEQKDKNASFWFPNDIMCLFFLPYIARNKSLKKLELVNTLLLNEAAGLQMAEGFFADLSNIDLHHLKISYDRRYTPYGYCVLENRIPERKWNWNYVGKLLHNQKSLQSLDITTNSPKLVEQVYQILENNRGPAGLQNLRLQLFGISGISLDCSKLKPLRGLKQLHVSVDSESNAKLLNTYLLPCSLETLYWKASFEDFLTFAEQIVPFGVRKNKFPYLRSIVQALPTKYCVPAQDEYVFLPTRNTTKAIFQMIPRLTSVTKRNAGENTTYDNVLHYKNSVNMPSST